MRPYWGRHRGGAAQNGIEAADQLRAVLGATPVLGGLCRLLAWLEGPGHVRHGGR